MEQNLQVSHFVTILTIILMMTPPLTTIAQDTAKTPPKKVIFETDMCFDVDDVGALAVLHALADNGEVEILAISYNEIHPNGTAAIDTINSWYNRSDIPIGVYKGVLDNPDKSKYLDAVANFRDVQQNLTDNNVPSSLEIYQQVLSEQPDNSVTIISVGFLNNLYDLLKAHPNLIKQKVVELVVMAGLINDNFNTVRHNLVEKTEYVIRNWNTPLTISQHGSSVRTGTKLAETSKENPVREAYYQWFNGAYKGRASWDQVAVLYGVRGLSDMFIEITEGKGRLLNGYEWQMKPGFRTYLDVSISDDELTRTIENLMIQTPAALKPVE